MKFCLKPSKKICCKTYALKIHHIKNILGLIRSQIGKLKSGSGRPEVYVNLTEDQAIFVLTLSKNTKQAVELKSLITRSFIYYRRQAEQKKIEPIKEKSRNQLVDENIKRFEKYFDMLFDQVGDKDVKIAYQWDKNKHLHEMTEYLYRKNELLDQRLKNVI